MGIGRCFLHDYFTAEETARRHESGQSDIRTHVLRLERDLGILTLVTRAPAELCVERGVLKREDSHARISESDLRDGRFDEAASTMSLCAACGRRNQPDRERCMYCGAAK